jgi:hypothetical protein
MWRKKNSRHKEVDMLEEDTRDKDIANRGLNMEINKTTLLS